MRILQVSNSCFQPIPPNNWGALEKIIWHYKTNLEKLGHHVDILNIDQVENFNDYDIVHTYLAYDAHELIKRGVDYVFSFNDHNIYLIGKNSPSYHFNLEAIKKSQITLVSAYYLIEFFENLPIYITHGVDTELYNPGNNKERDGILVVGNNGLYGENEKITDRKGFKFSTQIAKMLGENITIAGPQNNKRFFDQNKEIEEYERCKILYDLNDKELLEQFHKHKYLIHASTIEAGNPPLTITEAMASGLNVYASNCGDIEFLNSFELKDHDYLNFINLFNDRKNKFNQQGQYEHMKKNFDWSVITRDLEELYNSIKKNSLQNQIFKLYKDTLQQEKTLNKFDSVYEFDLNFKNGFVFKNPKENINGLIKVIDRDNGSLVAQYQMRPDFWFQLYTEYYVKWGLEITNEKQEIIWDYTLSLKDQKIKINVEQTNSYILDNWLDSINEFAENHQCEIDVFVEINTNKQYDRLNINLEQKSEKQYSIVYNIGFFFEENGDFDTKKHPINPMKISVKNVPRSILRMPLVT